MSCSPVINNPLPLYTKDNVEIEIGMKLFFIEEASEEKGFNIIDIIITNLSLEDRKFVYREDMNNEEYTIYLASNKDYPYDYVNHSHLYTTKEAAIEGAKIYVNEQLEEIKEETGKLSLQKRAWLRVLKKLK